MATINLGLIKFNWRGAYASGTDYVVDDVVSSGGSSYVCILASTGNATSNGTYWEQMSAAGTNGTNGTNGTDVGTTITTQGDILYRDGSGLARLAAGTSGQALITGGAGANPSWGSAGGGILTAFNGEEDTASTTGSTSTSFIDVGSDIVITPTATSDKVWVNVYFTGSIGGGNGTYKIVRTVGGTDTDVTTWTISPSTTRDYSKWYQDTPNTTSIITYKLQMRSDNGNVGHTIYINNNGFVVWQALATSV
jgi:hypothetical protein